jgi:glutathione S-transferase
MPEIILHHYPLSPYSEKIRLLFGLKGANWRSVEVPVMTPRPLLSPMTGGFRRIPIMQIGADFYCDTLLISNVIEKIHPSPSLFPTGQQGIVKAVCWWIEKSSYMNALCLTVGGMVGRVPEALVEERKPFFGLNLDPRQLLPDRGTYLQRVNAHMCWLAQIMSDGRKFIFGNHPSAADLAAYHPIWFARQNGGPEIEAVLPALAASPWYDRVTALGHGTVSNLAPEAAIEIARSSPPKDVDDWFADAANVGLCPGDRVSVIPDDYGKNPVFGGLLAWTAEEVVIRHEEPSVGAVNLHFPRVGFDIRADKLAA